MLPRGRHELHPADGARGLDVEVAAVVGLDLVDRREDLPAHAVLDAGGLVDREQEGRDPELVDEEVRDADRAAPGVASEKSGCRGRRAVECCGPDRRRARPSSSPRARAATSASCALRLPARDFWLPVGRGRGRSAAWPADWSGAGCRAGLVRRCRASASRSAVGAVTPGTAGTVGTGSCGVGVGRRRGDRAVVDDLRDRARDAGDRDLTRRGCQAGRRRCA